MCTYIYEHTYVKLQAIFVHKSMWISENLWAIDVLYMGHFTHDYSISCKGSKWMWFIEKKLFKLKDFGNGNGPMKIVSDIRIVVIKLKTQMFKFNLI